MRGYMTREDVDRFLSEWRQAGGEQWPGVVENKFVKPGETADTVGAVSELRERGIEATEQTLIDLRNRGHVTVEKRGKFIQWTPQAIDAAAAHLGRRGRLTWRGRTCEHFNIDPVDAALAAWSALLEHQQPVGMYRVTITPGIEAAGVKGRIAYRPLTADERNDLLMEG